MKQRLATTLLLIGAVIIFVRYLIEANRPGDVYWGHLLVLAIAISAALISVRAKRFALAAGAAMIAVLQMVVSSNTNLEAARNFYGVLKIRESNGFYKLSHGSTIHGSIRIDELNGSSRPTPRTYYGPASGMAVAITTSQQRLAAQGTPGKFGVVGLGAGSLACYAKPGETWRFFEINPAVTAFANNPKYFSFLDRCAPAAPVIHGTRG